MDEDWVVLCQALYEAIGMRDWRVMHEKLKEVSKTIGVAKPGQKFAGMV